ncbi:MAG TPA: hypothetical protein VJB36_07910 [Methylomirabilota bacterium]|nr:hypothetical protein [Methylomirabilota bacterium]
MADSTGAARARMEARFGRPGSGARRLIVAGRSHTLPDVMTRLGIAFEGCRTIDGFELGAAHFAIRYYDPEEQRIVAYEFDAEFRYLAETRIDVLAWVGEQALAPGASGEEGATWTST